MRKDADGQIDKAEGRPPSEGTPRGKGILPGDGVAKGDGMLPGEGVAKSDGVAPGDGIMPGADGQKPRGGDGQVDRGTPGQMDPWAPNPWAIGDEFEDFPESPDGGVDPEAFPQHPNFMGEAASGESSEGDSDE